MGGRWETSSRERRRQALRADSRGTERQARGGKGKVRAPLLTEPLVRASPRPERFRTLLVGNQHVSAQPRGPRLQLVGRPVRVLLDVAGRKQRQNALFDLLEDLTVPGRRDRVAPGCEVDRLPV